MGTFINRRQKIESVPCFEMFITQFSMKMDITCNQIAFRKDSNNYFHA